MPVLFPLLLLLTQVPGLGQETPLRLEVTSLQRNELPDDFPLQTLQQGFAVLRIRVRNHSAGVWKLLPEQLRTRDPGGKELERALPTDIAPRVMKFYTSTRRGIHGEGYSGSYGRAGVRHDRVPTISPGAGPRTVSASLGQEIRELLEGYQVAETDIPPGEDYEGLFYLKSKESGRRLAGSVVAFQDGRSVTVP